MARVTPFYTTDPALLHILDELIPFEPIFHRPHHASTLEDFDRLMAPDYWEVGASGRRYGRAFILQMLAENPPIDAATARWRISGQALRRLSPDTYLLTYSLRQSDRLTRRSTLWQSTPKGWCILYHQGTVVSADEDNVSPS
ncbi:MAG: DUF4440 domain-containing protein [Acidobacteriaceae bacterium]